MKRKELRVEKFLNEMNTVVPWKSLTEIIKPHYKKFGGRPPHDLELMLRIHFLQLWNNLSDPAMEEALYDRMSFQKFLGFDCFGGDVPDESSICRFRHLLEAHNLSAAILACVNAHLDTHGLILKEGTIVDATLLDAPVSKKNTRKERDPEMSSTRKNNKWHFGAKGHIGVQAQGKPIIHRPRLVRPKTTILTHWMRYFMAKRKLSLVTVLTTPKWTRPGHAPPKFITASVIAAIASIHSRRHKRNAIANTLLFVPK